MQTRRSRVYGPFRPVSARFGRDLGSGLGLWSKGLGWVFARTLIPTGTLIPEQPTPLKILSPRL